MADSQGPVASRPTNMAAYGVPSDDDGLLPWEWAQERLVRSRNYWLATTGTDARPHAMPVWGAWVPDEDVFFVSCDHKARKARNMRENPFAVVMADDTVEVVSVEGVVEELDVGDKARFKRYLEPFVAKYDELPPLDQALEFFGSNAAFLVRPCQVFAIIERPEEFGPRATRWRWSD